MLLDIIVDSTPLHLAVQHQDAAVVQILLGARASVDAVDGRGGAPITVAARGGNLDAVRQLLSVGASIDFAGREGDDDCGNTALQKAAWKGMVDYFESDGNDVLEQDRKNELQAL